MSSLYADGARITAQRVGPDLAAGHEVLFLVHPDGQLPPRAAGRRRRTKARHRGPAQRGGRLRPPAPAYAVLPGGRPMGPSFPASQMSRIAVIRPDWQASDSFWKSRSFWSA
jgi:hypothetical protein